MDARLLQNCNEPATGFRHAEPAGGAALLPFGRGFARESQGYGCVLTDFTLNGGRAAVKIDNRLDEREAETRSAGAARWIGAIEAIKDTRKMFRRNSGTVIVYRNLSVATKLADSNFNFALVRREAQCVIDQIS